MNANRIEYHQGAIADVRSAVAWYKKRSSKAALDLIEELQRAADTICVAHSVGQSARTTLGDSYFGDFPFPSSTQSKRPRSQFGQLLTAADVRSIGRTVVSGR